MGSVVVGRGAANPHGGEGGELDSSVVVVGEIEMIDKTEVWFLFCLCYMGRVPHAEYGLVPPQINTYSFIS